VNGALILLLAAAPLRTAPGVGFAGGFSTIVEADLERDVRALSSPALEGRDTPSLGLESAARLIEERFRRAGLAFAPDSEVVSREVAPSDPPAAGEPARPGQGNSVTGTFRRPFQRRLAEPDRAGCSLSLAGGAPGAKASELQLLRDFVPVRGFGGEAEGDLVFAGYGIQSKSEKYDDLAGLKLKGRIALIVEGEPRTDRRFDGPELSPAASLWEKIDALAAAGVAGVLAVRRPPEAAPPAKAKPAAGAEAAGDPGLSFRSTWAEFNGVAPDPPSKHTLPMLEVSMRCAAELLGQDVEALAARIDKSVHPVRAAGALRRVRMRSKTSESMVRIDNVVGLIHGADPALAEQYVVVGAHYDHVGIDDRGRIGCGADDNASGVAAMLEIAEALASAGPRRSVWCCAFAGEEDGLLGSKAFCAHLPVPKDRIVAMINLDMIGRGDATEVAALGVVQNPAFERLIARARSLKPCGLREVVVRQGEDLFERSDHFSFHQIGVPTLFFFEGLPLDKNKDYHTWRDTADKLDLGKMLNTTRLVYNATWILTEDDERPPPPRR
jgi:hypothetical protein